MNGMLLAAGHGRRMEPLSGLVPKPALELLGRPLLADALGHLERAGCGLIVVNLHRHPAQVAAAARAVATVPVSFSWEPELLGGAGGVAAARAALGAGPWLVANADVCGALDLTPLLGAAETDTAVLALRPHPAPARWGSVVLERDEVVAILPPGAPGRGDRYLFTGFQLVGAGVAAAWPQPPGEMAAAWAALRQSGRLRGAVVAGEWREAGSPRSYRDLAVAQTGGAVWVHPTAVVGEGAEVEASAVGAGCRVASATRLAGCVLTRGAVVEAGCDLRGCVIAGAAVPAGTVLTDAVIVPGATVSLA